MIITTIIVIFIIITDNHYITIIYILTIINHQYTYVQSIIIPGHCYETIPSCVPSGTHAGAAPTEERTRNDNFAGD
jgi:hypothetical protein